MASKNVEDMAPIVGLAVSLLVRGKEEPHRFTTDGLIQLSRECAKLIEGGDKAAILELLSLSRTLEHKHLSPGASRDIVRVVVRSDGIGDLIPELRSEREKKQAWAAMNAKSRTPAERRAAPEANQEQKRASQDLLRRHQRC